MKIYGYILAASLACTLFSCGEDGVLPEPEPPVVGPGDKDEPDEKPDKIQLALLHRYNQCRRPEGL